MNTHREILKLVAFLLMLFILFLLPVYLAVVLSLVIGFLAGVEAQQRRASRLKRSL